MEISSSDEDIVLALLLADEEEELQQNRRQIWTHPINLRRPELGEFNTLFPDLLNDEQRFFKFFRMSANKFFELVNTLPGLQKQETNYRKSISPMERLAVTLK